MNMGRRTVKNYPSPRLMETIGATNLNPSEAIGELVANSFDARPDDSKLHIVVDLRDGMIKVIDDGKGMTDDVLEKAVCIAEDMSRYLERGKGAKGHFGMGFKTSCSTLGGFYEIFTRPLENNYEYHVAFDIREYARRSSGTDAWDVVIEDRIADETGPLGKMDHGTAFVISRLKDDNITVSAVLDYLGEAFKGHLEAGDEIAIVDVNGMHYAEPRTYNFFEGTLIEIDTSCGPEDAYHITGWVGIDQQTHNNGNYGFNIYRNKQLVQTWDKTWFRAHLMTSRIIGEVNMDFLDATFYKQGLQQSEVWEIVRAHMTEYLRGVVKASRSISREHNHEKPAVLKKIVTELRETYDEDPLDSGTYSDLKGDQKRKREESKEKPRVTDKVKTVVSERNLILKDGRTVSIDYVEESGSGLDTPFDYIFEGDDEEDSPLELQVFVLTDHPLWQKRHDSELRKILATSDAIYRVLVEKLDCDASEALKVRNEWVRKRTSGEE